MSLIGQSRGAVPSSPQEQQWRIVQPFLDEPPSTDLYHEGTWGPRSADALAAPYGGWHDPKPDVEGANPGG